MPLPPHCLERVFHPVGQGAFYSETHHVPGGLKTDVVYDCGSTKSKSWIKELIETSFPGKRVDLLFLSHFHIDHYKGIEFLDPKYIVLPMLSAWDKAIFCIGRRLHACRFNPDYESRLRRLFKKTRFIYVRPEDDEESGQDSIFLEDFLPSEWDELPYRYRESGVWREIKSGSPLRLGDAPGWEYIPVNPKLDASLIRTFRSCLVREGIDEEMLLSLDYKYFNTHKEKIREVYREIGSPNEHSMAVYSGPRGGCHGSSGRYSSEGSWRGCGPSCIDAYRKYGPGAGGGCLYLGDMNLKEKGDAASQVLAEIYTSLPARVYECLSTIQVPHHGSFKNFNRALLSWYERSTGVWKPWQRPMAYVISAASKNRYGHPSKRVVNKLKGPQAILHVVTEDPQSALREVVLPFESPW